jgi:3-oxoacyl-[acyl-carrier protein] reductase
MSYSIDLRNLLSIRGRVALVTGAGAGIGLGIARVLAVAGGATVYALDRSPASTYAAGLQAIADEGGIIHPLEGDVTREQDIAAAFDLIEEKSGGVDILVNNAGTTCKKTVTETTDDEWEFILATNLTSCFRCARRAFPYMQSRHWGRIIQISSVVGHQGSLGGHIAYAATKSGQYGITKTLARTGAAHNITSNAVAPGLVGTTLTVGTHGKEGLAELVKRIPLGELSEPEDIGAAVLFLSSDAARHITGTTIDVNGGFYIRCG